MTNFRSSLFSLRLRVSAVQNIMTIQEDYQDIETPNGAMRTYFLRPTASGKYPAIILYSEIFQVTGPIRRTAAFLAGQGFVVAVPEIYHEFLQPGTVLQYDAEGGARGNELKTAKTLSAYDSDTRALLDALKTRTDCTGKIGATGISSGGHLAFRAATNPEVLASVCFYATDLHKPEWGEARNDSLDRVLDIHAEMMMVWGRQDPHIPREGRQKVYDAMNDADLLLTWHEFNGEHAFLRDEGARYNPALAKTCYELALELFKRKLGEGDLLFATAS